MPFWSQTQASDGNFVPSPVSIQQNGHVGVYDAFGSGRPTRHMGNSHSDRNFRLCSAVLGTSWAHPGHRPQRSVGGDLCPACALCHSSVLLTHFRLAINEQCEWSLTGKALIGAAGGDRTHDPWLRRPILYPLSYSRNSKKTNTQIFACGLDDHSLRRPILYPLSYSRNSCLGL